MPTVELNLESQIASEITRAELQTLISTNAVERKQYYITNAVNNTRKIAVFYRSNNQTTFGAVDVNTGVYGRYFIVQDMFIAIAEAQGAVLSYVNLASFPVSGQPNTVYIALDTGTGYTWNGSAYVALSGGTVFAANFGALPGTGAANTLYITTDNGNSYLWDGSAYVQTSSNEPLDLDFIPLSGTATGSPVTGNIQFDGNDEYTIGQTIPIGDQCYLAIGDDGTISLQQIEPVNGYITQFRVTNIGIEVSSTNPLFNGLSYQNDYSANYGISSLIDLTTLKSRLWNKAGVPTTSDDTTQGYVANQSLILDTTSGIIYKCTDASTGAAVWEVYYNPSKNKSYEFFSCSTAIGLAFPSGSTRFFAVTGILANNTITNSAFAATKISRACTLEGLEIVTTTTQPASGTQVWEIFHGSNPASMSGTGIQVTIPAGGAAGTYNTATTFNLSAGDYISFRQVNNASANSATLAVASTMAVFNNI